MGGGQWKVKVEAWGGRNAESKPYLGDDRPGVEGLVEMRDLDLERATCRRPLPLRAQT